MRKLFFFFTSLLIMGLTISKAQEAKQSKPSPITLSGGMWAGTSLGEKLSLIGFLGPKVTATFNIIPTTKIEAGLMGVPGLIIEKGVSRLGLSAGFVAILKKDKAKMKPVVGVMFLKTNNKWYALYGIGVQF